MSADISPRDRAVYAALGAIAGFALAFLFAMFNLRFGGELKFVLIICAGIVAAFALAGWFAGEKMLEWFDDWPFGPRPLRHSPNMALQRTRGLSAAQILWFAGRRSAVQILPGGRSPLNALALGGT